MNHRKVWQRLGCIAGLTVVSSGFAPMSHAEDEITVTDGRYGVYTLRAASEIECDAWQWAVTNSDLGFIPHTDEADQPTTSTRLFEAPVGVHDIEVTCVVGEIGGDDDQIYSIQVRHYFTESPSIEPPPEVFTLPKPDWAQPLCLTCPLFDLDIKDSLFDPAVLGFLDHVDPDFMFEDVAPGFGFQVKTPDIVNDPTGFYPVLETLTVDAEGEQLGEGFTSFAVFDEGKFGLTTAVVSKSNEGLVLGAFLDAVLEPIPPTN